MIALFFSTVLAAQTTGKISGKIVDKKTGEELIGVTILVEGTSSGAVTDFDGKYLIQNLKPGTYNLAISYVSYTKKIVKDVVVKAGEATSINVSLEENTQELREVVITTEVKRETANGLLIQQKNAVSVSDGISADAIRKTPDRNTSDVLKRVSGASIQDNRFAIIRGLNERYTAAYINGAPLPSSESDRKAFSFDIFPSNLLDNLIITKTATPDMPGEFGGGIIQINTKSIPDENFNSFSISGGYNSITTFEDRLSYKGGSTDWLGIDDGTRALPKGIPSDKNFPTLLNDQANMGKLMKNDWGVKQDKFNPNYGFQYTFGHNWNVGKVSRFGTVLAITHNRNYSYSKTQRKQYDANYDPSIPSTITESYEDENYSTQTLTGVLANFSYKLNQNHQIGFRNLYSINADDRVIYRNGTSTPLDPNPILIRSTAFWFTSNKIYSGQLNGTHYLTGPKLKINWNASLSDVQREIPNLRRNSYSRSTYAENSEMDTVYRLKLAVGNNVGPDYAGNTFYSTTHEKLYSGKADVSKGFNIKSAHLKNEVKIGGLYQHRDRSFESRQLGYIKYAPAGMAFPDSILYLPSDQVFDPKYMGNSSPGNGGYALSNKYKPTDSYTAQSRLAAAFIMFDTRFKERFRLIYGVRMESFEQTLRTTLDNLQPLNLKTTKTDFLPSVNFVYSVTEKQNIRLGYSQTVNRPEFRELAPFAFYDFSLRLVVSGNDSLTRSLIHNYDVRYEWYPGRGQMISVSGFFKRFINPIEQVARPDVSSEITYKNVPKADNYGVEFEFRTLLGSLAGIESPKNILNSLTVFANVALITSKVDVSNVVGSATSSRPLQGQSPYIINTGLQYMNTENGWSMSVNYNKVGQRIAIVGTVNEPDIWENGRDLLDFQIGKSFLKNKMDIKVNVKDILAQKQYFFQDRNHNNKFDITTDNHIWVTNYGTTTSVSFTYKF